MKQASRDRVDVASVAQVWKPAKIGMAGLQAVRASHRAHNWSMIVQSSLGKSQGGVISKCSQISILSPDAQNMLHVGISPTNIHPNWVEHHLYQAKFLQRLLPGCKPRAVDADACRSKSPSVASLRKLNLAVNLRPQDLRYVRQHTILRHRQLASSVQSLHVAQLFVGLLVGTLRQIV